MKLRIYQMVATSIVKNALECKSLTLADLYHALSMARLKCEWVKSKSPTTQEEVEEYAKQTIPSDTILKFGRFQPGQSCENGLFGKRWGSAVELTKKRIGESGSRRNIGLSTCGYLDHASVNKTSYLSHPSGYILSYLEDDFKKLINASTIFEYLSLTARMVYELSNYPPTLRGSLAVNKWIFNKIFKIKFQTEADILPLNADWMAFYETPEQFHAYFIISALAEYLKTMPDIYAKHKEFFDAIYQRMLNDPNIEENLKARKELWEKLKVIMIESKIGDPTQIAGWRLEFRFPSARVAKLVDDIQSNNLSSIDTVYFAQLNHLNSEISEIHLQSLGNPEKERELNELWVDLEFLRKNVSQDCLDKVKTALRSDAASATLKVKVSRTGEEIFRGKNRGLFLHDFGHDMAPGGTTSSPSTNLNVAMINGGMRAPVDSKWPDDIRRLLRSDAALLLYNSHMFIRAEHLVGENGKATETNILRLIAKIYLKIDLENLDDDHPLRRILLSSLAVELYQKGDCEISSPPNTDSFYKEMLNLIFKKIFHEDHGKYIESLEIEDVKKLLNNLIKIPGIFMLEGENKSYPSLKQNGYDLFVLIHLELNYIAPIILLRDSQYFRYEGLFSKDIHTEAQQQYKNWEDKLRSKTNENPDTKAVSSPSLKPQDVTKL